MIHPLKKQFSELNHLLNAYPEFVYSAINNFDLNGIPVFVYHTIDPESFEEQLKYIKRNNYQTLSIEKFYDIMLSGKPVKENYILLTIDDARSSVWRYAFPLLQKYEMEAVVFIIPGFTPKNRNVRCNLWNVWNGGIGMEELASLDPDDKTLCNWEEIKVMYESGNIGIESHTLFHREVFTNSNFKGFITSNDLGKYYSSPVTHYIRFSDIGRELLPEKYIGLPVFETSPLMLCGSKIEISEELKKICLEIYFSSGAELTKKNKVKDIIKNEHDKYINVVENTIQEVITDLTKARELIQSELDTNAGNHLCLPWTVGNVDTIETAKELGILSCFWGIIPQNRINKPGNDPYYITRLKNDFIFRLPGIGRKMLISIYNNKVKRRLSGGQIF